jgi:sugar-specific transcriptional regulator TrmB
MLSQILENIGLTPEQTDIYLSLVTSGTQSAGQLTKTTKVQRTYIYKVCQELIAKGLIAQTKKNRGTTFSPMSPDYLLTYAEVQKTKSVQAQVALEGILPTLKDKYGAIEERPVITYFEGVEGIKKVFKDIYSPKTEPVFGCVDLERSNIAVPGMIIKNLIPLRIKNNVHAKSLLADSVEAQTIHEKDKESLRESLLFDKQEYPLPAEIDVYEDKVAMLSFARGKFIGVLIQNRDIATSLKTIMKIAFESRNKDKS